MQPTLILPSPETLDIPPQKKEQKAPTTKLRTTKLRNALPIGEFLVRAGLISPQQLRVAKQDKLIPGYERLKTEEILVLRGWLKEATCEFFIKRWPLILKEKDRQAQFGKLGRFFVEAEILTQVQYQEISFHRQKNKDKRNDLEIAVAEGWLKKQTVDFLLRQLRAAPRQQSAPKVSLERAERHLKLKNLSAAILELREVLKLDASNVKAHVWLTQIYVRQSRFSLAKVHLKKAIAIAPKDKLVKAAHRRFFTIIVKNTTGRSTSPTATSRKQTK